MSATLTTPAVEGAPRAATLAPASPVTVPWVLDLVTGAYSPMPAAITFQPTPQQPLLAPVPLPSPGPFAGWQRALVKINMTGYTQANFVVEYEGVPDGWTLNIGDSRTNDGWSGDAGTSSCAEMQVMNQTAVIYGKAYAPGQCRTYGSLNYVLQDGALKVVVRDKFVSVGQPYFPAQNVELFQLPDGTNPDGANIYAAFNSVVSQRLDRIGKGLRRVMITLQ